MGKVLGFLDFTRQDYEKEPVSMRVRHWDEFIEFPPNEAMKNQGARCMDCGVPFCHWACPVSNIIPEFNDLVFRGCWKEAFEWLMKTNNFPEFTGRVCPAPCENSCVLSIHEPAVTIKNIEYSIIEQAYHEGWMQAAPPQFRTGKKIAVVGSGPSGLACADELNKMGHAVTVYEKNEFIGGILTLGIPDFKLQFKYVNRRIVIMEEEGVVFKTGAHVGRDVSVEQLRREFDAVALCGGAEKPRDLPVEGRDLQGVYFAMDYLTQQNRINRGVQIPPEQRISAAGKRVIIIGGGDTGADCVGTARRQGAASIKQFELLPEPPKERPLDNPWPQWARILRTSSSHEEGCVREFSVSTKRLTGEQGVLKKLHGIRLEFSEPDPATGRRDMKEIPGSEFTEDADMVVLAMGFVGPIKEGMLTELGVKFDERGNIAANADRMTSVPGVFAAGDMRRGQSLVVWAIHEGRAAAKGIERYLAQKS